MNEDKKINVVGYLDENHKQRSVVFSPEGVAPTLDTMQGGGREPKVLIKQATKKGYIECNTPGVADLSYLTSSTRRGRVQENGAVSPTIMTSNAEGLTVFETNYRIRKMTPLECWRLMGFSDEDFYKAQAVNSNTQLYKQAGNSIVVNCLEELFKQLF